MSLLQEGFLARILASGTLSDDSFMLVKAGAVMLCCVIIPYLLGSISSAVIVSKVVFRDDVRRHGSGNAGATNMLRTYGARGAVPTVLGDILKAALSILSASLCCGLGWAAGFSFAPSDPALFIVTLGGQPLISGTYLAGVFCVLGHVFPVYYRFKGGKGVLCSFTVALLLNLPVALVLFLVFVIMVAFTRYISLGSVTSAALYPVFLAPIFRAMFGGEEPPIYIVLFTFLIAVVVIVMHRGNIRRLLNHEESRFSFHRHPTESESGDGDAEAHQ